MAQAKYEKSGYYYPNLIARIYLESVRELVGSSGTKALLNLAGMQHLVGNYPPANLVKEFDFADIAYLNEAMEILYGSRGGRAMALRAGRRTFDHGLGDLGPMAAIADGTYRLLPLRMRVKVALGAMATAFALTSDQTSHIREEDEQFVYVIERCPVCWGRQADGPICHAALGILLEGLDRATGGQRLKVAQTSCRAAGDPSCNFAVTK